MTGLTTIKSEYSAEQTIAKTEALLKSKGYHIFTRISHRENAAKNNINLRPTELIIFGNPKVGTGLMQDKQSIGIDLPSKVLAWEDEQGQTWLTHNKVSYLAERHKLSGAVKKNITALEATMSAIKETATKS